MKLSVCVPSHRQLEAACGTILHLLNGFSQDVEIVVSDNSLSAPKRAYLEELASRHRNLKLVFPSSEIHAYENFRTVLAAASGDLITFCGDDDIMYPQGVIHASDKLAANPQISCVSGAICNYRPSLGPTLVPAIAYTGDWGDRVLDYLYRRTPGGNFLFYAVYRRATLNQYARYLEQHPFIYIFFDFHLPVLGLVHGEGYIDNVGLSIYDNSNWETAEACARSWKSYCDTEGLPYWFIEMQNLYRSVEYLLLIGGNFIDRPKDERIRVGLEIFQYYFSAWARRLPAFQAHLPASLQVETQRIFSRAHPQLPGPGDAVELFVRVLAEISPDKAARYQEFFGENMGL